MKRAIAIVVVAGCGGASAEGPLTVAVGTDRARLVADLRHHAYCVGKDGADPKTHQEMFPRCDQPGVEFGQSWVVAVYDDGGEVMKVQRWEKYTDPEKKQDRFNDLVAKRSAADGTPTDNAKALILGEQQLPPGTKTWVAFQEGASLVGVYLLDPVPPAYADVLEEVIAAPQ